jgi:C_GCAxxG_C_C family probable redox protein
MSRADHAVQLFQGGHACSQAVLLAWAVEQGLDPALAARLATGLGGGMHQGGLCGAASGAVLVLGLVLGGETCVTKEGREPVFAAVEEFMRRFRERAGSLDCPEILGCDLRSPDGLAKARAEDRFASICEPVVRIAVEILEDELAQG